MKLTALEIKQQNFEKSLRGYDIGEVTAFLNVVANEWEYLVAKNRDLERDIEQYKDKLKHYEKVEDALHETLQAAKESSEQRISTAKNEAKNRIQKAEMEAENIVREATQKRHQIRQDILLLLNRRNEIVRGMKSYLELAQESLGGFSKDDAGTYNINFEDEMGASAPSGTKKNGTQNPEKTSVSSGIADSDDLDDILDHLD